MTALRMTYASELKMFAREPAALFFTIALPLLLLVLNGTGTEGGVENGFGGASFVDVMVPAYTAMVLATSGLMALPETLATYRERGVLRRFRATPLPPATLLGAHVAVHVTVTAVGLALLAGAAALWLGLRAPADVLGVAVGLALGAAAVLALAMLLGAIMPTTRTAQAAAAALYFPMLFLSGAVIPRFALPDLAQRIGAALPLTYVVRAMQDPWIGSGWHLPSLAVCAATALLAALLATRTFRWE